MAALPRRIEDVRDIRARALLRQDPGRAGRKGVESEFREAPDRVDGASRERDRGGRLRVVRGHCSASARANSTHTSIGISRPAIAAGGGG